MFSQAFALKKNEMVIKTMICDYHLKKEICYVIASATSSLCDQYLFFNVLFASARSSSSMSMLTFGVLLVLLVGVVAGDGGL